MLDQKHISIEELYTLDEVLIPGASNADALKKEENKIDEIMETKSNPSGGNDDRKTIEKKSKPARTMKILTKLIRLTLSTKTGLSR